APPSRDPEAEQKNFRQNENQVGPAVTFNRPNGRLAGQFFLRKRRTSNRERRIYLWSKGYTRLFSPSERHWFMCRSVVFIPPSNNPRRTPLPLQRSKLGTSIEGRSLRSTI